MATTDFMTIDFSESGEATALHRDVFDLGFLGNQSIKRASEIIFNETLQAWTLHLMGADGKISPVGLGSFPTYNAARDVEVEWLEQSKLAGVDPESFEGGMLFLDARAKFGV